MDALANSERFDSESYTQACVRLYHCECTFFISSPHWCVKIEIRQCRQRCQCRGRTRDRRRRRDGLKLNGKLCTSIKTWGEHIKSHTPVPGDRMREGKTQCEATVQSESRAFLPRRRIRKGGGRDRMAQFNNVLEISVEERTTVHRTHNVIEFCKF